MKALLREHSKGEVGRASARSNGWRGFVFCLVVGWSGCVDPPTAQSPCEDEVAEELCTSDDVESLQGCCEVLDPILRTQFEPLSETQQDFVKECAIQFTFEEQEEECIAFVQRIATTWKADAMVSRCALLHNTIDDLRERERDFMLACVDALTLTQFEPDASRDPVALTYFCASDDGDRSDIYTRECLQALAAYDWFPGTAASSEAAPLTFWTNVGNVPELCWGMGGPPLCKNRAGGTGTIVCIEALQALSFDAPDAFALVSRLQTIAALNRSCRVVDSANQSMYANYGVGGPCLQTENTAGVTECMR